MAREYLIRQLDSLRLAPLDSVRLQPFSVINPMKKRKLNGQNILAAIPGTEADSSWVIVTAHYDHVGVGDKGVYNGADDNASGTCALLAIGEHFISKPPKHNVLLVWFDGEETGLIGSKSFVDNLPLPKESIIANINCDMVGRNKKDEIYLCGEKHHPELFAALEGIEDESPLIVLRGHDGSDRKDDWTYASDHANFHREGIPFCYIGVEDHPDYHRTTDDFDKINSAFYQSAVDLCIAIVDRIAN